MEDELYDLQRCLRIVQTVQPVGLERRIRGWRGLSQHARTVLEMGDLVDVVAEFAGCENTIKIRRILAVGERGRVLEVDAHGHALIDFEAGRQWVAPRELSKVRVCRQLAPEVKNEIVEEARKLVRVLGDARAAACSAIQRLVEEANSAGKGVENGSWRRSEEPCEEGGSSRELQALEGQVALMVAQVAASAGRISDMNERMLHADAEAPKRAAETEALKARERELKLEQVAYAQSRECQAGHVLNVHKIRDDTWECDSCGAQIRVGEFLLGCRLCDWDICARCYSEESMDFDLTANMVVKFLGEETQVSGQKLATGSLGRIHTISGPQVRVRFDGIGPLTTTADNLKVFGSCQAERERLGQERMDNSDTSFRGATGAAVDQRPHTDTAH